MRPLLILFTGGTIGSRLQANQERQLAGVAAASRLLQVYYASAKQQTQTFCEQTVLDCLSENLTPDDWNQLCRAFQGVSGGDYQGVICTHGTDTLAETAAFLSVLLHGMPYPVVLVSANAPLWDVHTNGHTNFAAAVSLLQNGLPAGVWVVYQNTDAQVYVHRGAQLIPCQNGSDDFFSPGMCPLERFAPPKPTPIAKGAPWLSNIQPLTGDSLLLRPYPGLRYDNVSLAGIRAVVHGTYHSETANALPDSVYSVQTLLQRCQEQGIPCFLAPCKLEGERYATTACLLRAGAIPLPVPIQLAYAAVQIGSALGYHAANLVAWVKTYCEASAAESHAFRCDI